METTKIKVAWICVFSNEFIRKRLKFRFYSRHYISSKIKKESPFKDIAQWITNGINEIENIENIELHVISFHSLLIKKRNTFTHNNITYHILRSEDDYIFNKFKNKISKKQFCSYDKNSLLISNILKEINPQIIHLIGAENPMYSSSVIKMRKEKPILLSLQTLMSDPNFFTNYPISLDSYKYRSNIEKKVIERADYIGTPLKKNGKIISQISNKQHTFINITLPLAEPICISNNKKTYDFVYFAKEIEKAADWAIEAFHLAFKQNNQLTLLIIGGYSDEFKRLLDTRIEGYGMKSNITFTGTLPTHNDVINKIKEAQIALLPLKIDFISGTIREAISLGLPVITTKTLGTPTLNEKRESVLISEPADYQDMAQKMLYLINNKDYANTIRNNALKTINETYNNTKAIKDWIKAYKTIIANYHKNVPLPEKLLLNFNN